MQMPSISTSTTQRLSRMKSERNSKSGAQSSGSSTSGPSASVASSARLSSATLSSLAKQSDASLRSRVGLPTIAGSPSVHGQVDGQLGTISSHPAVIKETPTKIPRKSGRTSASSPSILNRRQRLLSGSRRTSLNLDGILDKENSSISEGNTFAKTMSEFGVLSANRDRTSGVQGSQIAPDACLRSGSNLSSRRSSPSNSTVGPTPKGKRDNPHPPELRKSSTMSTFTNTSRGLTKESVSSRFSALSPSKSLKFLSAKSSLSTARLSSNASHPASPSSSRQSLIAPSPTSSSGDDDEALADEEMMAWMKRQQTKAANSSKRDELGHLLVIPDAFESATPATSQGRS
jgi:dual specificity tyrosine-phosphorylation-regulated kinase 2/3/4